VKSKYTLDPQGEVMATLNDNVLELLGPGQCFGEAAMMHVCRLLETGLTMVNRHALNPKP
jgi:hypothetical protein